MTDAVLVDTSALYAVLDRDDTHHAEAATAWTRLLDDVAERRATPTTHSAVVVETSALVQRRLGLEALRALYDRVLPLVDVVWIGPHLHARAVSALLGAGRSDVSLVDRTSFELMRERGIDAAFAYDDDFPAQGFVLWQDDA